MFPVSAKFPARGRTQLFLRCVVAGKDLLVEPGANRPELLVAVVAIDSGLDLEPTLRRIVETAVALVDASYGARDR
jgi:hypothetical protein